jgi:hypothetical protein
MPTKKWAVIESVSASAIRRHLLFDAVQRPTVLLSLALGATSAIYLVLLSPVFGGRLWAATSLGISATLATASFIWHYMFRYREEYAKRVRERMDRLDQDRKRLEQAKLGQLHEGLHSGFSSIGSEEGIEALSRLVGEYELLHPTIQDRDHTDPRSMSQIPGLIEKTYRRGLSVLSDTLELMKALQTPNEERLKKEIAELERGVAASKVGEGRAEERLKIQTSMLTSHKQRLDMLDQLRLGVDQLLYQAGRCEASLHRTRIELAAIRTGSWEISVDSVIEALQGTIHQVKEVQEELSRLGY